MIRASIRGLSSLPRTTCPARRRPWPGISPWPFASKWWHAQNLSSWDHSCAVQYVQIVFGSTMLVHVYRVERQVFASVSLKAVDEAGADLLQAWPETCSIYTSSQLSSIWGKNRCSESDSYLAHLTTQNEISSGDIPNSTTPSQNPRRTCNFMKRKIGGPSRSPTERGRTGPGARWSGSHQPQPPIL